MKSGEANEIKVQALQELEQAESFMVITQTDATNGWLITAHAPADNPMGQFTKLLKEAFVRTVEEHPNLNFRIIHERETEGGE